jgi:nitrogen-specific signal transduction histidine kinase
VRASGEMIVIDHVDESTLYRAGPGLGLYIVSKSARSHGGAMDVTSRDGQVTFTFSRPSHGRPSLA